MLHYQLPPRRFWFWWCDGFQVYDALVVAVWIAVNVLYVQQRISRMFYMTESAFVFLPQHMCPLSTTTLAQTCTWYLMCLCNLQGASTLTILTSIRPLANCTWTCALLICFQLLYSHKYLDSQSPDEAILHCAASREHLHGRRRWT